MTEKIRVLQSVGSLRMGGNEIFVMNFFRHIDKEKFQLDFVIYDDSGMFFYDEIIRAGSKIYICKRKYKNKYIQMLSDMIQVKRILRKNFYDVIHCHACSFVGILRGAIPGKITKRTTIVAHAHSVGTPKNTIGDNFCRQIAKSFLSSIIDVGCACSDTAGRSKYTKRLIHSKKYKIINNAIETDKYIYDANKRAEIRKRLEIGEEDFVIGNVGRLEYEKNQTFLIDILKVLREEKKKAVLLLVGDGSLRTMLEMKAEKIGIASNVIFAGKCESAAEYYQAMDCFVLPSHYEGFPFVLVEAQVNSLHCIVSENMTKSVNISGGVQFLSLELKEKIWADKIYKLKNNRMGVEEVNRVVSNYNLKKEVLKLEKIYEECVKR